jgi:hypothetical protein
VENRRDRATTRGPVSRNAKIAMDWENKGFPLSWRFLEIDPVMVGVIPGQKVHVELQWVSAWEEVALPRDGRRPWVVSLDQREESRCWGWWCGWCAA